MNSKTTTIKIAFICSEINSETQKQLETLKASRANSDLRIFAENQGKENLLTRLKELMINQSDIENENLMKLDFHPDIIVAPNQSLEDSLIVGSSYAEIFFSNKDFMDFTKEDLEEVILDFETRNRNFGV